MQYTVETAFVNGDKQVSTGNTGTYGPTLTDAKLSLWQEAHRIREGLGADSVTQEVLEPTPRMHEWEGADGRKAQSFDTLHEQLAVRVDGRVVVRLWLSEHRQTIWLGKK
jgi:hypothetical protein